MLTTCSRREFYISKKTNYCNDAGTAPTQGYQRHHIRYYFYYYGVQ